MERVGGNAALLFGKELDGFDRFDVSQLQFSLIKFFDQVAGASRLTFVSEFGATYGARFTGQDETLWSLRVPLVSGHMTATLLGRPVSCDGSVAGTSASNINTANCVNEGYTTDFSWGYRVRIALDYNDVFAGQPDAHVGLVS